ncbi:HIR complex subunit [Xanthoria parietina]
MMSAALLPAEPRMVPGSGTSSPSLSSPPTPHSPSVAYPQLPLQGQHGGGANGGGGMKASAHAAAANDATAPPKQQRKPRKKKEPIDDTTAIKPPAKPRKPRAPKGTSAAAIKKEQQRLAFATAADAAKLHPINPSTHHIISANHDPASPHPNPHPGVAVATPHFPNGKFHEAIPTNNHAATYSMPSPPPPRPASGQNYDPIRSATLEPRLVLQQQPQALQNTAPHGRLSASTPPRPVDHASISPSIASLLDPHSTATTYDMTVKRENDAHATSPPESKRPRLTPPETMAGVAKSSPKDIPMGMPQHQPTVAVPLSAVDVDTDRPTPKLSSKLAGGTKKPSGQSSSSHSPKTAGRKETAIPPLPPGNGLLSSAMLGGGYDSKAPERTAPTVILHVPLNGDTNKYVNFARLAEEQYGFDALHPRLAAQRERLARVAAAGAALENVHKTGSGRSADEMSVDLSEGEPDADNSNVEMGGVNGNKDTKQSEAEGSEVAGVKRRKKRTMKEDMYDKDDPFVDDAELAFEEQAAATKDGFFVYSGLLVPEGEKANVERSGADGATRGRGRGRGRGARGGATGGTTRGGAAAAAAAAAATTPVGGVGGVPTTTLTKSGQPRKQRVTKAAKAQMEQEKAQRESMAPLAAKPTNYPG